MLLLRRNTSKPAGPPPTPPSFQVHLKLNTHEFLIRLEKLRQLTIRRAQASTLIQVLDPSHKLIQQIAKAEKHMRVMRRDIRDNEHNIIGERRYFGECILLTEAVVGDLRTLLYGFHKAYRPGAQVPAEFLGRGEAVSNRLDELCDGFVAVRRALAQEAKMRMAEEEEKKKKKKKTGTGTRSLLSELSLLMTTARTKAMAKAMTKEATMMTIVVVQRGANGLVFRASRFPAAIRSVVVASAAEPETADDDDGEEEAEGEEGEEGEEGTEGQGGKDQGGPPLAAAAAATATSATATLATVTALVVAKATTATTASTTTVVAGATTTIPNQQRKSYWDANGQWYCDCCRYLL